MALDVSRFPEPVINTPAVQHSESYRDGGQMHGQGGRGRGRGRGVLKRKRSFSKLFGGKGSLNSKERATNRDRNHPHRVNSFHPRGYPLPTHSPTLFSIDKAPTMAPSKPTRPHFVDRRPRPRPPQLEIPRLVIDSPPVDSDLIFPPTPKIADTTTRDTIKALGLSKIILSELPKTARTPPTNPAIFGDGVPTFSTVPPPPTFISYYPSVISDTTGSKSMSNSSPGSADKPLPSIPNHLHPLPSSSKTTVTVTTTAATVGCSTIVKPPPRSASLHAGVADPTRGAAPHTYGGRRQRPPPIILPTYKHTSAVPCVSPQPRTSRRSRTKNTGRGIPTIAINSVVMPTNSPIIAASPHDVIVSLLTPTTDEGKDTMLLLPLESKSNLSISQDLGNGTSLSHSALPYPSENDDPHPHHLVSGSGRHMREPRGPHLQEAVDSGALQNSLSGPKIPRPPPRSQKRIQKGSGSKGLEKCSSSANGKGRGKRASRMQEEIGDRKGRPFLAPLNTSLNRVGLSDPWAEEDKERSAIGSGVLPLGDGLSSHVSHAGPDSGSGSLIGSGYAAVLSNPPNVLWGDKAVAAKGKPNNIWEDPEFREVLLQVKDM